MENKYCYYLKIEIIIKSLRNLSNQFELLARAHNNITRRIWYKQK